MGTYSKRCPQASILTSILKNGVGNNSSGIYRADYRKAFRAEALVRAFENGQHEVYLEAPRRMEDGSYRWYSMQAQFVMRDAGGFRVMLYLKDLDDAKKEE